VNPCILHQNNGTARPSYCLKEDALLPAMFNPLYSSTNQQLFKRTSATKVTTMKITRQFRYKWTHVPTTRLTLFVASKDGTKRKALVSP